MAIEADNIAVMSMADFSGGINTSVPPQMLQPNEYQLIKNFEFDMNRLRTRGGLSTPLASYPDNISAVFYDNSTSCYIVCLKNGDVYEEDLNTVRNKVGTLNGTRKPCFCRFDGKIFIASGGHLQYFDYKEHTVKTIKASYLCDYVFERFGRLVTCHEGDDNLYYSAVGDPYETGWKDNTNDDASAKFIEVGYKDDGDILTALPMSGDIVIFKTNGRVYSLNGEYPSWSMQMIGDNSDCISTASIVHLGASIAFLANGGLKTLDAVQNYGNFNISNDIGRRINRELTKRIYMPELYNIIRKRQLIIIPDTSDADKRRKAYCYQYDTGAFICFEFAKPIDDMQDTQNGVIIASGNALYRWDKQYGNDSGTAIRQEIITKESTSTRKLYSRRLETQLKGNGTVWFTWAGKRVPFKVGRKRNVIELFSVCPKSCFGLYTDGNIEIEYANLYFTEK